MESHIINIVRFATCITIFVGFVLVLVVVIMLLPVLAVFRWLVH